MDARRDKPGLIFLFTAAGFFGLKMKDVTIEETATEDGVPIFTGRTYFIHKDRIVAVATRKEPN